MVSKESVSVDVEELALAGRGHGFRRWWQGSLQAQQVVEPLLHRVATLVPDAFLESYLRV